MNTTNPDDDPTRQAAVLIGKLTILLGDFKKQVEANATAIAALEKLVHAQQQQFAQQLGDLDVKVAQRQHGHAQDIKTAISALSTLTDERATGLHARLIVIIVALAAIGGGMIIRLFA